MNIQWYPGHMTKARRQLEKQLARVDLVLELCDARLPQGSRNPDLDKMIDRRRRILILNKVDLADPKLTNAWIQTYKRQGLAVVPFIATQGKGSKEVLAAIERVMHEEVERKRQKGMFKTVRAMVVGIPNVGKSAFTNRLYGGAAARVGDRPGVTRGQQWVRVTPYLECLDTPGLLWPKLSDPKIALNLAFLGAVRDEVLDTQRLAANLLETLRDIAPEALRTRCKLQDLEGAGHELLERACIKRGWLMSGGVPDIERGAAILLDEFRAGRMGAITLEAPKDFQEKVVEEKP